MAGIPNIDIDPPKYGPPNMAAQLFGMISSLPDAYQQGVKQKFERGQLARTEELQKPYEGPTDYASVLQQVFRTQGSQGLPALLPVIQGQEANDMINSRLGGGGSPPGYGPQNPRTSPDAQTPGGLRGETDQPQGTVGQYSISDLATRAGGLSDPKAAAANIAKVVGVAPGARLTDEQEARVRQILAPYTGQGDAGDATGTTGAPSDPRRSAPPNVQPGIMGGPPTVGPSAAAQGFSPYQPGAPPQAAPGPQVAQAAPGQGVGPAATPVGTEADARFYEDRGNKRMAVSAARGAAPGAAAAAQKAAEEDFARAKAIRESLAKYAEPTTEMKNAASPAVQQREIDKLRSADFQKNKEAIFKAGQQAEESIPQIELSRRIVTSPGFNSGFGHQFFDSVQSLSQQLFGGTELKNPGELYDKFRSGEVLNQIRSLGASGVGAVRVPEMKAVDKLIADRDVQAPGIRAVTEVESRLQKRVRDVYYQAQEYLQTHRELDDGFSKQISAWKNKPENHLFSEAELAKPELLSMPVFSNPGEMRASKMPSGTPFRTPSGEVGHIP